MTVEVYSSPGSSTYQSTRYSATVNGVTAYVYGYSRVAVMPTQAWSAGATVAPAWFQFGADETATVAITRLAGAITSAVVYPKDKGVTQSIAGGVLTLRVPTNVRLWVECNGDRVPIIIQSRPLKPALPSPRTDWTTLTKTVSSINTGTNVITCSASHGLSAGTKIVLATTGTFPAVTGTALSATEPVYILSPSGADLKIARTLGGTEIDLTSGGTGTLSFRVAEWTNASNAIYFPAGVHTVGRLFKVGDGVTVYIDGGAVLVGTSFDLRGTTGAQIIGAGQVFCTYALWADVQALPFEQLVEYAPFLGLDFVSPQFGYDNEVAGIMLAAWPYFFAREGVAHWENVIGVSPWNYNNDGFDCSVTLDGSESTVDHCLMFCGDDGLYLESNWFTLHATDLFVANSNGGSFLFGYWGEANQGKFQKLTDCDCISLAISDEVSGVARAADSVLKLWNDNRESEAADGYGRFNVQVRGLKIWGNFENRLLTIENYIYPFPGGLARDGLGDVADILLQDIVVEETPDQLSPINGSNWLNTPHDIQFVGCEFEGVKLTASNFFGFFEKNAYPYNITVEGQPVVTAVDISNTALDLIGHAKRITDISPPDGSAEATVCAEHYSDCVNELLDSHDWNFATVKRALVAVAESDDPAWDYCYELPAGLLRVISIIQSDAPDNNYTNTAPVPVDYEIHADEDDVVRIYTDLPTAWIRFVKYVTNTGLFSPSFIEALQWKLASRIAGPLIKGTEGSAERDRCTAQYMMAMGKAATRDARQQQRQNQQGIASWHAGADMASTRQFVRSWSGGEIAPELFGRLDDARYQQGAEKLRNFICRVGGSLQRRPGFDYVRETKDSSKRSRLIPFVYSTGQAYAVEMGEGYFRFHADGGTLLHVTAREVASVDDTANTITFTQPHGFASNETVRMFRDLDVPGVIPTGLGSGTTYYAIPVDTHTIQVEASIGGGAINILSTGTLPLWMYSVADCPAQYVGSKSFTSSTGANTITTSSAHGFSTGDRFTMSDVGTIPAPLVKDRIYYAIYVDATNIQAATTAANAAASIPVDITGIDSGTQRIHKYYEPGDIITNLNSPAGFYSCRIEDPQDVTPGSDPTAWHYLSLDGVFEIPNDYDEADLFEVHHAQSSDIKTLVHQSYPPSELRRRGATEWDFTPIVFNGGIDAPTGASMTPTSGYVVNVTAVTDSGTGAAAVFTTNNADADTDHYLKQGDLVYLAQPSGLAVGTDVVTNRFYVIGPATGAPKTTFTLVNVTGGDRVETSSTTMPASVTARVFSATADTFLFYRVTALDDDGRESDGSGATGGLNNILAPGALNTVNWSDVSGADRYNVYRARNGIYGYIGTTTDLSFVDDNIAPDMSTTLPLFDQSLSGVDYPGAVAYFEGRRVFAGSFLQPQTVWMTNTSLTDSLIYHIPVQDTDRIVFQPDSTEASTIQHLLPLQHLVAITNSTEYRIGGLNTDPITPSSISVRPQSYVGGSSVQPVVVNRTVVFVAFLGGHLFEMGYTANDGYQAADLCLRSPHLFDDTTVVDLAYVKSPVPVLWAVSSDGRLLGCTYAPEEQVGGWHVHTTAGTFESVCAIPEGDEYRLYAIVNRTIDGATMRNVERLNSVKTPATLAEARHVDGGGQFYGIDTTGTTISITPASSWASGSTVTVGVSSGSAIFRTGSTDVGDKVLFNYLGRQFVCTITAVTNGSSATATLDQAVTDANGTTLVFGTVPSIGGITFWGWKRDSLSGLDQLEGEEVQVLADGVLTTKTVSSGAITGLTPSLRITYGLPIASELLTLPLLYGSDSYGQARTGAISEVWLRTRRTETFQIAQGVAGDQVPFAADFETEHTVDRCMPRGRWDETGQLYVYQDDPYPLTLVSMTIKASIGS